MHALVSVILTLVLYVIIGFKYRAMIIIMRKCPEISPTIELCQGLPSLTITFTFMYFCSILALFVKWLFYKLLALLMGMETLTLMDDLQLWDIPANPEQVPSIIVLKKSPDMGNDHGQFFRSFLNRIDSKQRAFVRIHKKLGKYFIEVLNKEDKEKMIKSNCAVIEDIRNEKEAIDFCLKLKACVSKGNGECPQHYYYFPNYSKDEIAISFAGHHCLHDGITQL